MFSPFLLRALCVVLAVVAVAQEAPPKVAGTDVPPPKRTHLVLPEYPPEAQEKGQHGIVILELLIDTQGKVTSIRVIRSIPPFDDAAVAAAKQWEYEVTRVDGRPVAVLLTVPITFALRVPEVSRQEGVPELRAGTSPIYPKGARGSGRVVLDVTLSPEGQLAEMEIVSGENPFRDALLQAVRTWRFAAPTPGSAMSFRIEADFEQERRGAPDKVAIRLTGLRTSEAPAAVAQATPPPAAPAPEATPAPVPLPTPAASSPASAAPPTPTPTPTAPSPLPTPEAPRPSAQAPAPDTTRTAPPAPPTDVLTAPAPPRPLTPTPVAGSSAVENVTLGVGVPDLAQGRRPVAPPFARMAAASGSVEVRFAVNAAGQTSILSIEGPPLLKAAAHGAVSSWGFRRTKVDRLYLTAVFTYDGDAAKASVSPTTEPPAPSSAPESPTPTPPPAPPMR